MTWYDWLRQHQLRVNSRTSLLFLALCGILALCAWIVGGVNGILVAAIGVTAVFLLLPRLPSARVMRFHHAVPIPYHRLPYLHHVLSELCRRAGLQAMPTLYCTPDRTPNAFAVGQDKDAAIAISAGAFRLLGKQEVNAVMAHEVAHIANRDCRLGMLTEIFHTVVFSLTMLGVIILLMLWILIPGLKVAWWLPWLLALAPLMALWCQRAIARNRELAADALAVELLGDPAALLSALKKIERSTTHPLLRLLGLDRRSGLDALFQTHPEMRDRIGILQSLSRPRTGPSI